MKKFIAFTLAEVLASLTIIGVIAALTIPVIHQNTERKMNAAALKKYMSVLNQVAEMSVTESKFQPVPKCFYWDKNPYGGAKCVEYNSAGDCSKYELSNGNGLPGNYNGEFAQCKDLLTYIKDQLNVVKYCPVNGVDNGCMPEYNGNDTAAKEKNPNMTPEEANKATTGCGGWRKSALKSKMAMVTADGMILFPYDANWPGAAIIAIDVNGKKGPNKWGYDVFSLQLTGNNGIAPMYASGGCSFIEKGGAYASTLLQQD